MPKAPHRLSKTQARHIWLRAQRLDSAEPFGAGSEATRAAITQLGYVQIDTINVIERCHHHILQTRIPAYRRADLAAAQSTDKTTFEYWTHALAYVPIEDFRFYVGAMTQRRTKPFTWFGNVDPADVRKLVKRIRDDGPLSIRDVNDDELVEKDHPWASRKPSKAALQVGFLGGQLVISARSGMVKTYELTMRHFGWDKLPKAATEKQITAHLLDRALRAQGVISLDSAFHLDAKQKPAAKEIIVSRVKRKELVPVEIEGAEKVPHWALPAVLEAPPAPPPELTHILSPFDPLIIQRKRTAAIFDYSHLFEAYVPKDKRKLGYFALPVLVGDEIVAALDIKADRAKRELLMQSWTWMGNGKARRHKRAIEEALHRFEAFQFAELGEAGSLAET